MATVEKGIFRGTEAYFLKNDSICVTLLSSGGKVASIRKGDLEYLYQNPSPDYIYPEFGKEFGSLDCSGFDDMVPTINAGYISDGVFAGIHLVDHGEVWALDWDVDPGNDFLKMSVHGVRLPYMLRKKLMLNKNTLVIDYELENKTEFAIPCLWAAHILIRATPETRIVVPEENKQVIVASDMCSKLNGFGTVHSWPETKDKNGNRYSIDRLSPENSGICEKFYFDGPCTGGVVGLENPDMRIRFDPVLTPYLGVWLNANGYKDQYNIAVEPASAPMDSPEIAKQWGYDSMIEPKSIMSWSMEMEAL